MNVLDGVSATEAAYLIGCAVFAVTVAVVLVVAWARAEARSRIGERERVAAIRVHLAEQRRQPVPGQ